MSWATEPKAIQGFLSGGVSTAPNANQVLAAMTIVVSAQVRTVMISANGVPNANIVVDLLINGVSAWSNPSNRPTIPSGSAAYSPYFGRTNKRALKPGNIVVLVVITAANNVGVAATAVIEYPESAQ